MRRETEGSRKYLEKQENIRSTMEGDFNTANVETVSYKKIVSIFAHLQIVGEEFIVRRARNYLFKMIPSRVIKTYFPI